MPNPLTVREQCLAALEAHLGGITAGAPGDDPYLIGFGLVTRAPLTNDSWKKQYALGVHESQEQKITGVGMMVCKLRIILEFRLTVGQNQSPSTEVNMVMGQIQRRIADRSWLAGLAVDCIELSNETYIDNEQDKRVSGAVFVLLTYRHDINDPRLVV